MSTVTIGPSFFKKELKDYASWRWAYIREALQNCIDAPKSKKIHVQLHRGDKTIITFSNDGEPMDLDTITNKLLCLGESGKNFEGSVGGFGKAKILLYFAQVSYSIRTGQYLVQGQGGDYSIITCDSFYHGTESTVVLEDNLYYSMQSELEKFAAHAQWDGTLTYTNTDGKSTVLPTNCHKGTFRKEEDYGRIYTNNQLTGIVCRIHGIPMFVDSYSTQHGIVLELPNSGTHLTSNRDMLQYKYHTKLCGFIKTLNSDYRQAISVQNPTVQHFRGYKCAIARQKSKEVAQDDFSGEQAVENEVELVATAAKSTSGASTSEVSTSSEQAVLDKPACKEAEAYKQPAAPILFVDFYLRNETRLEVPNHYLPGQWSEYAEKLLKIWVNVLRTTHSILNENGQNVPDNFSVGYLFSQDAEAMYSKQDFSTIYYLNPCKIVTDKTSTRLKKRFLLTEKERIICIAMHEVVHSLGFDSHDEAYACKLTDCMALAMKNRSRFNADFRV